MKDIQQDATQTVLSPQMLHQLFGMDRTDNATDRIDNEEFPRHTSGLNSTLPKEVRTWGQMKSWAVENALDTPQELLIKLVNINLVENAIYQCQTGLPALRHENGSIAQVPPQIWSIAEALKSGRQQTSYLPLVPSYATPPNTTSTSNPDSLRDRQSEAQPTLSPDSRQFTSFSETTKRLTDWPKHLPDGYTGNDLSKSGSMNVKPPQTLSHFTPDNIKELLRIMADIPAFQKAFYLNNTFGRTQSMVRLSQPFRAPSTSETTMAFVLQSIIYVMSSCRPLLRSFRSPNAKKNVSPTQYSLPFNTMTYAMKALIELELHPPNVIPCLCRTTAHLFARLPHGNYIRHKPGSRQAGEVKQETWHFRTETQVAHILKISLAALTALIPDCQLKVWELVQRSHAHGLIVPRSSELHDNRVEIDSLHAVMSSFENDMALNLVKQLVNAIASRLRVVHLHEGQYSVMDLIIRSLVNTVPPVTFRSGRFGRLEFSYRNVGDSDNSNDTRNGEDNSNDEGNPNDSPSYGSMVYEWLRRLLLKEWDGNVEIRKSSTVASVLEVMSFFYDHHWKLRIHPDSFHTYYFSDRLDSMEMPVQWMSSQSKPNTVHLLEYHFFFPRSALVTYFRAINFSTMREAYEETARNSRMLAQMSYCGEIRLPERFEYLLKSYFVMDIRRENMLQDTFNQLWMRNRKELFKPLKVRMGMDEGEEGVDHGGVQQEYYRFAVAQFLDPDYGLFTRDEISHTSWFHPCPLEPLWKMELIGILFGLGVYNGVTLPISFPRAFYCKLLRPDKKFKLDDIKDGWPVLAKGLQDLLNWTDGDVKDVFARSYVFSADVERLVAVDMKRIKREDEWQHCWWCDRPPRDGNGGGNEPEPEPEPDPEPEMVTNANRKEYVADYIFWLTDKSIRPQFAAFLKGFHVCVPPKALSIFSPDDLQELMEGVREIDVADLKAVARLEGGFAEFDEVVQNFWAVVREFDQEQLRMLLQFVTASDRLPADGVDKLAFSVQKNGEGDERLPTSLTCFGRLLLPAYSSKEKLREKLCVAIENSKGFGTP